MLVIVSGGSCHIKIQYIYSEFCIKKLPEQNLNKTKGWKKRYNHVKFGKSRHAGYITE